MIRTPQLASVSGLDRFGSSEDEWEVFESFNVRGVAFATYTCDIKCTVGCFYTRMNSRNLIYITDRFIETVVVQERRFHSLCYSFRMR